MTQSKDEIVLNDVYFSYQTSHQRVDLFQGLNLTIPSGKITAITGPSGRGKTSLLNLIAGFISPDRGEIYVSGKNITQLNENGRSQYRNENIGYVFQFFNLISKFNVENNVSVPLLIKKENKQVVKQKTEKLLRQVGMFDRGKHYPEQLSGGEQQRVAIARALINEPRVILADEPTGNLDKKNAENILGMFRQINEELGITVVMVTHDDHVRDAADHVINFEEVVG